MSKTQLAATQALHQARREIAMASAAIGQIEAVDDGFNADRLDAIIHGLADAERKIQAVKQVLSDLNKGAVYE